MEKGFQGRPATYTKNAHATSDEVPCAVLIAVAVLCLPTPHFFLVTSFPHLLNGVADAAVWHLYVKHGTYGGSDICHVCRGVGGSLVHLPSHEQQWDV